MKRLRDDKFEYLGGDLQDVVEDCASDEQRTKADRNIARKLANKKWKLVDRKVGSGVDPSPRHTLYYRVQLKELADSREWERFQDSLTKPLSVTFRFGGFCPTAVREGLTRQFEGDFQTMKGRFVEVGGVVLTDNIVKRIEWPGSGVYQVAADSLSLSKNEGLQPLSSVLRREVGLGHLVRQELASMIPALLLEVEGHHNVLDLCAAPGSKTEQLLSLMKTHADVCSQQRPTGMVVANDPDPDRILTLKGRYDKCLSPNFLVTCATAERLAERFASGPVFERILADVPCSGDGTIRKFPHIWRLFRPRMAIELHQIQLCIGLAAVTMLRVGGRLVYSTCSINPIEDEAVVAGMLRKHWKDGLRLVDTRKLGLLPMLHSRPGVSTWRCDEDIFLSGETDDTREETLRRLPRFVESLNPPSETEAERFHLDRCHRILPHDNDTGGFFVAVLELNGSGDSPIHMKKYKAENVDSHASGKKKVESIDIMKQLGYNPKRLSKKPTRRKPERNGGAKLDASRIGSAYEACAREDAKQAIASLALDITLLTSDKAVLACGENIVWSKDASGSSRNELSIVSRNVMEALNTWAKLNDDDAVDGSYSLVHAGVPVAHRSSAGISLNQSAQGSCETWFLAPYAAHTIRPLISESLVCRLSPQDFSILATVGSLECDSGALSMQLSTIFSRTAVSGNEPGGGKKSLSNLSNAGKQTLLNWFLCCIEASSLLSTIHLFVVVDMKHQSPDSSGNNSSKKIRLSKAERKKLKQSGLKQCARNKYEIKSCEREQSILGNYVDATIVIRCDPVSSRQFGLKCDDQSGNDFYYSYVTPSSVCLSYANTII